MLTFRPSGWTGPDCLDQNGVCIHLLSPYPRFERLRRYRTLQKVVVGALAQIQPAVVHAQEAGADLVGLDDYLEKLQQGWLDCDVIIDTPDVMSSVGKLGKVLGPKGMMPNPKSGTVTFDVGQAVKEVKAGKIDFRVDRNGYLHAAVGKISFEVAKIKENVKAFLETVLRLKPTTAKGLYIRSVTVSTTMGPGITLNRAALIEELK